MSKVLFLSFDVVFDLYIKTTYISRDAVKAEEKFLARPRYLVGVISDRFSSKLISYEIHPDFKGRGIATAAVSHCLAYTDANLDIHKIN